MQGAAMNGRIARMTGMPPNPTSSATVPKSADVLILGAGGERAGYGLGAGFPEG
jgi:hypothetical protein